MKPQTPRDRFLTDKESLTRWQSLTDSAFFVETTDRVLAEYAERLDSQPEPTTLQNAYRLQGARAYRKLLLTFADPAMPARAAVSDRLEPEAEHFIAPGRARR